MHRLAVLTCACLLAAPAAEREAAWRLQLAAEREPGERLTIRGRALQRDGKAVAGTTLLLYQTDASGVYGTQPGNAMNTARLRGRLTTGPNGEYEVLTIRPGAYPGGQVPAHIHVCRVENGREPRPLFEFLFAGDPALRGAERGYVLTLRKDARTGAWLAVQDIEIAP